MLDLKKCRDTLQEDGEQYTDEEITIIYTFLNQIAELTIVALLKPESNEESYFDGQGEF
ncbi:MAG: hypothetical protein U0T79_04030 [Ferruginibacter sp.]